MSSADVKSHVDRILDAVRTGTSSGTQDAHARVRASWKRCIESYGLDPAKLSQARVLEGGEFRARRQKARDLLRASRPHVVSLHAALEPSGYCVLLTDNEGATLERWNPTSRSSEFKSFGVLDGTCWSERDEGTGAIGLALSDRMPITIHGGDHFRAHNLRLSCSAAPVFDHAGDLLAILNATALGGIDERHAPLVQRVVMRCSERISNSMFLASFGEHWILSLSEPDGPTDLYSSGLIAFDDCGRIVATNVAARAQLSIEDGAAAQTLASIIDQSAVEVIDLARRSPGQPLLVRGNGHGRTFLGDIRAPRLLVSGACRPAVTAAEASGTHTGPASLLVAEDAGMTTLLQQVTRLARHRLPVLILGETGVGKELMARELHQRSDRADKPFVALNCAAIPEGLIESELFGYQPGAFTGARASGLKGKVQLAFGGTLFLDEIGDMPLHLQSRLLRVLSEGEVLPLGSDQPIRTDIRVVCATHRDLSTLVAEGRFREDLYFRLNAATLRIPAVRQRSDVHALVRRIFQQECEAGGRSDLRLPDAVVDALAKAPWPGNVRQIRNALAFAVAMGEGDTLQERHFPPDLFASPVPRGGTPGVEGSEIDRDGARDTSVSGERARILDILAAKNWRINDAARALHLSRATLYRRMSRLGIHRRDSR